MNIFETLKKLSESKRKDPSYIYLEDNQIKERKLSELLDSAGSGLINRTVLQKSTKINSGFYIW
jgi:hypothetical protein